ncbi:MAG: hypothetical protein JW959_06835 [Pirellulales bacterium]|nr:hypothetical protein [Pirellulales bacterium]
MYSRWFNVTVVVLWLATMSWLVRTKVLPLLEIGEPPRLAEIVESQRDDPPIGWEIFIDKERLGWALTETKSRDSGMREVRGRVHFDELPLAKIMPGWLKPISQVAGRSVDELRIDARSVLTVDALGHLLCFESAVRLDPLDEVIGMSGLVEEGLLKLSVSTAYGSFKKELSLPPNALPSDFFSPQTELPGLRGGRTWTVPIYSPLWPSKDPVKIVRATVEGTEPILWNGGVVDVWKVVYRDDTGTASDDDATHQAKTWVRKDGAVLQQQARFSDATLTFVRLGKRRAEELVESAGKQWWAPQHGARVDNHD